MALDPAPSRSAASLQEWMAHWSDLEHQLSVLLLAPRQSPRLEAALREVLAGLRQPLTSDPDAALYWLFQLAAQSTVGYSASHALVCAGLCHVVAPALGLDETEQERLLLAALTMNIAMTRLQDDLAAQSAQPTPEQRDVIASHAADGAALLRATGVTDVGWLDIVAHHHGDSAGADTATRLLMAVDRYAAIISPRETRSGRCVTDSARSVIGRQGLTLDEVGHALLRAVGICPPGTFVRLEDQRIAVVLRRSEQPGNPWVAPVLDPEDHPVIDPALVNTAYEGCGIEAALVTKTVRVRLNHVRLLQLAAQAA